MLKEIMARIAGIVVIIIKKNSKRFKHQKIYTEMG